MRYTWQQVADVLLVSRTTLWRRLNELDIPLSSYSDISDAELDGVMELLVRDFPNNGIVMMWGQLRSMNIIVTCQKVHDSLTSQVLFNTAVHTQLAVVFTVSLLQTTYGTLMGCTV